MTIKASKAASRERTASQNGLPELVPYVYRQQKRRNTYAARIAQRNAQGSGQSPALAAGADETLRVAARRWSPCGDLGGVDALGAEYPPKGLGDLRVPVQDQEPEPADPAARTA